MTEKSDDIKKILLIDLENCPSEIKNLHENIKEFHKVVICYAQTGIKIPLDWLIPINEVINQNRLEILKMPNGGKNSADFGITFLAGSLAQKYEKASYSIISNDNDLNHVVDLLIKRGNYAERLGKTTNNKIAEKNHDILSLVKEYCNHLIIYEKNRPSKKKTLLNSINAKFKGTEIKKKDILQLMVDKNIVIISGEKTIYNNELITDFAKK